MVGMLTMLSGFAGMMGAGDAPPEVRRALTAIPPILQKLSLVVGKINFYQSSASYTTFEEGARWRSVSVQNYKEPKAKKSGSSKGTEEESGGMGGGGEGHDHDGHDHDHDHGDSHGNGAHANGTGANRHD
jgi:hypothetical protein